MVYTCHIGICVWNSAKFIPYLFNNLKITQEKCFAQQGQYPVIYLTFKGIKYSNYPAAFKGIKNIIADEYLRHDYLQNSKILKLQEKNDYEKI